MKNGAAAVFAVGLLVCLIPAAGFALAPYSQDFEAMDHLDPFSLSDDGWLVYGNVFDPDGNYLYGYGPFPAPNDGFGFCQVDTGEGGLAQGHQQLVVFSDYNNTDHGIGNLIESNTFQEQVVTAADVGNIWTFAFQAKMGNLELASTAVAFIKTLDPSAGWALTNFLTVDMTAIPIEWGGYSINIPIDASLENQVLQIGFANTATNYEGAGIFYDNIVWQQTGVTSVPVGTAALGATLDQNYPNPFNPLTRIDFALDRPGMVDISVFDIAGRRIASLHHGELGAGEHHVTWDGKTNSGTPVSAGQYRYVLKTATGQVSRSMVLLK
ncbi:MAG: FlgD immunoglobulin-like domain containing protein [Candidatus Krumholzibacteriota bacterium]